MKTKSQLLTALKLLSNELNQEATKAFDTQYKNTDKVDFSTVKKLTNKISDTVVILDYLTANERSKTSPEHKTEGKSNFNADNAIEEHTIQENHGKFKHEQQVQKVDTEPQTSDKSDITSDHLKNSIVDKVSMKDSALADKFRHKGINDLSEAIGISEKFMFVQELFDGNTERYTQVLNQLNSCSNNHEVDKLINMLKKEFSWNEESDAFQELHNIISRKYPF